MWRLAFTLVIAFCAVVSMAGQTRQASAGTIIFSDGQFNPQDWALDVFRFDGNGGIIEAWQETSGGNPGSFRVIRDSVFAYPPFSGVQGFHGYTLGVYDPSMSGSLLSVDMYYEDAIMLDGFGVGQRGGPALKQSGQVYVSQNFVTPELEWTPHSIVQLTETSFYVWEDSTQHPDFSPLGGPIQFGFWRGNWTPNRAYAIVSGIDNWMVVLTTEGPTAAVQSTWGRTKRLFR